MSEACMKNPFFEIIMGQMGGSVSDSKELILASE